jgi:hypothetical protein
VLTLYLAGLCELSVACYAQILLEEFKGTFPGIIVSMHPDGIQGETPGKGNRRILSKISIIFFFFLAICYLAYDVSHLLLLQ